MKIFNIAKYCKKLRDTSEYNNKFITLINAILEEKRINSDLYNWLTEKVNSMQVELGSTGLLYNYIDPIRGIHVKNYQLLLNFLPETNTYINQLDNEIALQNFNMSASCCVDMFLRHTGDLKELHKKEKAQLYNEHNTGAPLNPISEMADDSLIRTDDIVMLWPNWHTLIHKLNVSVNMLSEIIKS